MSPSSLSLTDQELEQCPRVGFIVLTTLDFYYARPGAAADPGSPRLARRLVPGKDEAWANEHTFSQLLQHGS